MNLHEKPYVDKGRIMKVVWRTGKTTTSQLCIDTDGIAQEQAIALRETLQNIWGYRFSVLKTLHGFHLIGEKHLEKDEWLWENCIVLNTTLLSHDRHRYVERVKAFDDLFLEGKIRASTKEEVRKAWQDSGLVDPVGNIDILYTKISIVTGRSTLRISKKIQGDKYELIA